MGAVRWERNLGRMERRKSSARARSPGSAPSTVAVRSPRGRASPDPGGRTGAGRSRIGDEHGCLSLAIVTGGNRGIGRAIVEGLWQHGGFHTIIACRSTQLGQQAADEVRRTTPVACGQDWAGGCLEVMELDLTDSRSVTRFARAILGRGQAVRVLCNNAGVLRWKGWVATSAGIEEHLHANYLGHFLLVRELLPALTAQPGARVIAVGSNLAHFSNIHWDDMNALEGFAAYGQSKLCNLLHMQELHQLFSSPHALCAFCIDPGEVNTDITRFFPCAGLINWVLARMPQRNTPQQGADSAVWLATTDMATATALSGQFVRNRAPVALGQGGGQTRFSSVLLGALYANAVESESHGPVAAKRLWAKSHAMADELRGAR